MKKPSSNLLPSFHTKCCLYLRSPEFGRMKDSGDAIHGCTSGQIWLHERFNISVCNVTEKLMEHDIYYLPCS